MNLKQYYSPGTRQWKGTYSDKRTSNMAASGQSVVTHEDEQIKTVTTYEIQASLYPKTSESLKPLSFLETGILKMVKPDAEYGNIHIDLLLVGDCLINHFHSENGEHRGSSIVKQLSDHKFHETGFAYNAPDDILRWETVIEIMKE